MMHHGLIEHFDGQSLFFEDYVIENWAAVSEELARLGMKLIFTGHFHSQDIRKKITGDDFIFDIETGSSVTFPCPYRVLDIDEEMVMTITTKTIQSINYNTGSLTFPEYALAFLEEGMTNIVTYMLMTEYAVSAEDAAMLSPVLAAAIIAHYSGDETLPNEVAIVVQTLSESGDPTQILLAGAINNIYNDPAPADNNIVINLKNGTVQ